MLTKRFPVAALACGLLLLGACTSGTQKPAPGPLHNVDQNAPAAERTAVTFENLSTQLGAAQGNCDQVAAHLSSWLQGHRGQYGGMAQDTRTAQLEAADRDAYQGRLDRALGTILDAVAGCPEHAATQAAFTEFDVLLDPR